MIARPCFLVGAERSGTTMFRLMLSAHPQIAWSSEFEYAVDQMPATEGWPDLDAYREYLRIHRIFRHHEVEIDESLAYPELVDSFLRQIQQKQGNKPVVGATVHHHFDRLTRIWPDARFIHLLRDGRDTARSTIKMGWAGNMWTGVERWIVAEETWAKLRSTLAPERFVEVRYEDLVQDPQSELTRVCAFLGVEYDPAMLQYDQSTQTFEKPDPKFAAQWKSKLTPREIQLAEARILPMLKERGYEPSGLPVLTISPAMQKRLRLQDYWERVRFGWKYLGTPLFLESFVARRIGSKSWRDRVTLKVHDLVNERIRH